MRDHRNGPGESAPGARTLLSSRVRHCACSPTGSGWSGHQRRRQGPHHADLAGEGQTLCRQGRDHRVRSVTCRRTPREGDLDVLARVRVLSARGLDTPAVGAGEAAGADGRVADIDARDRPCAATASSGTLRRARRIAPPSGAPAGSAPAWDCRPGVISRLRLSGGQRRRVDWPASCSPRPGIGLRHHPAARRAHQPPRRRLDRLAAPSCETTPADSSSSATMWTCWPTSSTGCSFLDAVHPVRPTSTTWAGRKVPRQRPTDSNGAAASNAPQAALASPRPPRWAPRPQSVGAERMLRRAERMIAELDAERVKATRCGIKFPTPAWQTPFGVRIDNTARWRSSPGWTWPSTAARAWWCSGSTARARRRCCGCWPGVETRPMRAAWFPGHGRIGYFAPGLCPGQRGRRLGEHPARRTRHRRAGSARTVGRLHVHRSAAGPAGRDAVKWREGRLALAA